MEARRRARFSFFLSVALWVPFAPGCRNCDLVEAELRSRDNDLRELRGDLARAECQNEALMRELQGVRSGLPLAMVPEQARPTYTLKEITLGRSTGGYDGDDCPGDDALQVVVEPRDCDGHAVKVPGLLHVEAFEITSEGLKVPLSTWDVPPDQLRRTWKSGLLMNGYVLVLPWKNWPSSEKLRVLARLATPDGRIFEADRDVTIRLTPVARRRVLSQVPATADPERTLPLPTHQSDPRDGPSTKAWWRPPPQPNTSDVAASRWRPQRQPSLADAVELLKPVALKEQPGE